MHSNRRQLIECLFAAVTVSLLVGCDFPSISIGPGQADFSARLAGDYFVYRTSAHQIMVAPEIWNDKTPMIPTKVVDCALDRHFVFA